MIILSSGAQAFLEVISVRAIKWISQVGIVFNKCGVAMASIGNIKRGL